MEETLKKIMNDIFQIPENEITDETSVENTESWDSLKHMELIACLEEEFEITFTADEIVTMNDFSLIKQYINEKGVEVL